MQIAPTLFIKAAPVPLAIGMREQLRAAGLPVAKIGPFLRWWCSRGPYLKTLTAGAARFGLDGRPCGEVSDQEAMERRNSTSQSSRLKGKGISPAATR